MVITVRKLSDSDKRDILNLYQKPGETTSTLADRYGVSNSTISRLLKSTLPEDEYEGLIQQKRAARVPHTGATSKHPSREETETEPLQLPLAVEAIPEAVDEVRSEQPQPQHLTVASELETETPIVELQPVDPPPLVTTADASLRYQNEGNNRLQRPQILDRTAASAAYSTPSQLQQDAEAQASAAAQMLGEDLLDESEDLADLDDEDEDLEDLDEDDLYDDAPLVKRRVSSETLVQVLPLSEATLPKTCYLVIDRASELITRPLKDFGELGQIPNQEVQQRTLPVFDNHRVARRFSTKRDRVIKIPDSKLLQKTRSHLQAKGITRLLVDGQVYSF